MSKSWEDKRDEAANAEAQFCYCAGPTCSGCETQTIKLASKFWDKGRADLMEDVEGLIAAVRECRIYCLGSDCSTLSMIERLDKEMAKFRESQGGDK